MVTLALAVLYKPGDHAEHLEKILRQNYHIIMPTEQVQVEDRKVSGIEMAALEKRSSVEVGEVSEISEHDIGTHARWYLVLNRSFNESSGCRGRIHRGTIQTTSKKDRSIPLATHVVMLWYSADR